MRDTGSSRWNQALRDGLQHGWLALLPLALLPVAGSLPAYQTPARAAVLVAALLAWAGTLVQRPARSTGIALLAKSGEARQLDPWKLSLLGLAVAIAVGYFVVASRIHGIIYNDGAYYYGVARHMALSGRFEEPIVWHFLHPPERIVHAPFDYWGCMTSLLLVPALVVFGATPETAFLTMSFISSASVVAFWYLICVALPLRYRVTQLLALVLFAFSPAMDLYRFQPESVAVAQLFLILALIAFCRGFLVPALLCGFAILLTRGDGLILFALIFLALLFSARRGIDGRPGRAWCIALVGGACMATYVLWSLVSFGTLTPPAPRVLPFLGRYMEVYNYPAPEQPSWRGSLRAITPGYMVQRIQLGLRSLRGIPFVPVMDWWLAIAVVPALGLFRHGRRGELLIWLLCFGGYFLLVWVNGRAFAPFRTPYTFTPLIVLAGALGVDAILSPLHAWVKGARSRGPALVVGAGIITACALLLGQLPVFQRFPIATTQPGQGDLSRLDALLGGAPVATNLPWYMIAYTQSPAVSIPTNGERAIDAILARYDVHWLVIFGVPEKLSVSMKLSGPVVARILDSETIELGRFRLERASLDRFGLAHLPLGSVSVYRVRPNL